MNLENDLFGVFKNKEKTEGDPLHRKITEITGVPYERIKEIEKDVLYLIKIDPEVKDAVILFDRLATKYKDGEMIVAVYSAGLVMGIDRGRKNSDTFNRLHEALGGL